MTVLDGDKLEKAHVHSLFDMQQLAPNFEAVQSPGWSNLYIRGVGGGGRNVGWDSRVGVYLDGVYIGQTQALEQPLADIEQMEVLRGPQGHLFGRNTGAGAVSITTRAPSKEFEASISAGISNYSGKEVAAYVSGPMTETVQGKLSIASETRDGFIDNIHNGKDLNDLQRLGLRGQISMQPSDKLSIDLRTDYSKIDQKVVMGEPRSSLLGFPLPGGLLSDYDVNLNTNPYRDADISGISGTVNYELASGNKLTSITAYRSTRHDRGNDTDGMPQDFLHTRYSEDFKQASQELRIASPDTGKLRYVGGVYFLNEIAETDRQVIVGQDTASLITIQTPGGPIQVPFGAAFLVAPGAVVSNDGRIRTTNLALFGNVDYDLTDDLTLNLGARYTHEKKRLKFNSNGTQSGRFNIATLSNVKDDRTENRVTPTVGLNYALNPNTNVYAKFSTGFKSGGWNVDFLSKPQVAAGYDFDTETVKSYEIGLKGEAVGGKVQYDLAVFNSKFDDYQLFQVVPVGISSALVLTNAGKVDSRGIEASARWRVNSDFNLGGSIAYLDTRYDEFKNGGPNKEDLSGNRVEGIPHVTASLNASYGIPVASLYGKFEISGDASFRGSVDNGLKTNQLSRTIPYQDDGSYTLFNAQLRYIADNGKWSANLWARNLTDKHYYVARGRDVPGNEFATTGVPRTYGVTVKYDF